MINTFLHLKDSDVWLMIVRPMGPMLIINWPVNCETSMAKTSMPFNYHRWLKMNLIDFIYIDSSTFISRYFYFVIGQKNVFMSMGNWLSIIHNSFFFLLFHFRGILCSANRFNNSETFVFFSSSIASPCCCWSIHY